MARRVQGHGQPCQGHSSTTATAGQLAVTGRVARDEHAPVRGPEGPTWWPRARRASWRSPCGPRTWHAQRRVMRYSRHSALIARGMSWRRVAADRRLDLVFGEPIVVPAQDWPRRQAEVVATTRLLQEGLAAHVRSALVRTGQSLPDPAPDQRSPWAARGPAVRLVPCAPQDAHRPRPGAPGRSGRARRAARLRRPAGRRGSAAGRRSPARRRCWPPPAEPS